MDIKLSQPQSECIQAARENNGRLYRYDSNVWSKANAEINNDGFPVWYFQNNTVKSLIDKNIFKPANFIKSPGYRTETFMTVYLKDHLK